MTLQKKLLSSVSDNGKTVTHTRLFGYCAVFKVREEVRLVAECPGHLVLEPPAVSRSLKTQQHAAALGQSAGLSRTAFPGPVDMLVPDRCWY